MSGEKIKIRQYKIYFTAVFLWALLSSTFAFSAEDVAAANETGLTLERAITIAFKNNKDIQIQEQELNFAKGGILGARSAFLPHVDLDASYTHNYQVYIPNIFTGYNNDNLIDVSLVQSVYKGGANISAYRQAQISLTAAEETLRAKKLDVEFEARRLYYGLLFAYETERIAVESLGQAKAHYEDVKKKYEQGTASRFDLLQSKVQVSLMEPEVVRSANDVFLIKAELNKLLGINVNTPVEVKEKLTYTFIEINESEFLQSAYLNTPELKLKELGIDINKWGIQMAKAGYRPQVDILADYTMRSNDLGTIFKGSQRNWNAGVAVKFPLFEGFSTKAKVDEAKAQYAQAKISKENVIDQIAVDIRRACLDLKQAEAIINSQKDNVEEAREALRISALSYDSGVGINLDVMDAQVSLTQIQNNLAGAIYDYLMSQAYLDRTMGKAYVEDTRR